MYKNKFLLFLLSVVVAFALWAYVITFISSEREDTFYDIPVSYQGEALLEDRNLMVTTELKPTVNLTLYGDRVELNKLDSGNITILVDLSKIGEAGIHNLRYNVYYPGDIPDNAFPVRSQYPSMVSLEVERRVTKDIPIVLRYTGTIGEDYIPDRDKVELTNPMGEPITTVQISGPSSSVDKITQAVIEVDLTGRSVSFSESYRFTLCDAKNQPVDAKMVEANMGEVHMTLYIKRVKEIKLVVEVIDGGGATEETSSIEISPKVIKVAGSESALRDLEELKIGTIDLTEMTRDTVRPFTIVLPAGVENLSNRADALVTVKFPALEMETLTVTSFKALNVPEGLEVEEFITEQLPVILRGPKGVVSKMTASDITVTVDFTGAQEGTDTFKANIVMGSGYSKVGAIGTYKVTATLKSAEKEDAQK